MKSEFKAKYLQHLLSKKKNNEGFTLIELLVVIIIVGVLAAIALPSFLSQISRARASEGVTNVGSINRGQQVFRYQNTQFSANITDLDAQVTAKYYDYSAQNAGASSVETVTETNENDLKLVSGYATQVSATEFKAVVCIGTDTVTATQTSAPPASTTSPTGTDCDGNGYAIAR
jgi:type IV pilus assembly protein PilA